MGQGTNRDAVDTALSKRANRAEGNATGSLSRNFATCGTSGIVHCSNGSSQWRTRFKVIQQHNGCATSNGCNRFLDRARFRDHGPTLADNTATNDFFVAKRQGEPEVILLQQDLVEQADAMIDTAARENRGLLDVTQTRRRLAGIQDARASTSHTVDIAPRHGRHAG